MNARERKFRMATKSMHRMLWVVAAVAASVVLAACGSDSGSSGSFTKSASNGAKIDPAIPASGCGAVTLPAPKDPDGILATLPPSYQKSYAGYVPPVTKSVWSDFKPDHPPPYKVGIAFAQLTSGVQANIYNGIKKTLEADPDIKVTAVTTGDQLNIPQQQQQFSSLLNAGQDLLIVEPLSDAFGKLADEAGKKGVPTISLQGRTSSDYAINVQGNAFSSSAFMNSHLVRQMGGKGNVLFVHGIASVTGDIDATNAFKSALKNCPGIKQVGEIAGAFSSSTAKVETLKFLATHPGPIDAVSEVGGMSPGIMSAFQQSGRPMPIVTNAAGLRGGLGFWINNKDKYHAVGGGFPPRSYGKSVASIAQRVLAGRGVKLSDLAQTGPLITDENLDQWAETEWNLNTPGVSEGPPGAFMSEQYISGFFNNPAPAK
jgi:ribose transport system substrate-binding protein